MLIRTIPPPPPETSLPITFTAFGDETHSMGNVGNKLTPQGNVTASNSRTGRVTLATIENRHCRTDLLTTFAGHPNTAIRTAVGCHPNCPESVVRKLLKDRTLAVAVDVAEGTPTPPVILYENMNLLQQHHLKVIRGLLLNSHVPSVVLFEFILSDMVKPVYAGWAERNLKGRDDSLEMRVVIGLAR
jgi:hypothetical protein